MANFDLEQLESLEAYRAATKVVLKQIKDKELPFIYSEKHKFKFPKGKVAPIFICEKTKIDPKLIKAVKEAGTGAPAEGTCYRNAADDLVLHVTKGTISAANFDVAGIAKVVVALSAEAAVDQLPAGTDTGSKALPQDKNPGGTKINIDKSKLEQFPDVLKRQKQKLDSFTDQLSQIKKKQEDLKQTLIALASNKPLASATKEAVEIYKNSVAAANDVKLKLSEEFSVANKGKNFAAGVLQKAAQAKTDEDKAEVVFSDEKFGSALKELDGSAYRAMMATNDAIMVLGRTSDTWALQLEAEAQPRTLMVKPELYTLTANDAFMKGGIDIKARFQLVTEFSPTTIKFLKGKKVTSKMLNDYLEKVKGGEPALWDTRSDRPAVSAREVGQLLDDGYWFGVYPKADGSQVQMMFPRALQQDQLDEIAKFRKG